MLNQESTPRSCAPLSLSMRPITTPVNILVTGGSYVGKTTFIKRCCSALGPPGGSATSSCSTTSCSSVAVQEIMPPPPQPRKCREAKLHSGKVAKWLQTTQSLPSPSQDSSAATAAFALARSSPISADLATQSVTWPEAITLKPVLVPEACREVTYMFQETPGHGTTVDPASHLQSLMMHILAQREKDYKQLAGSRGLHKSLACGCLENSVSLCIYLLPPHGPSKLDLVMMAHLSKYVSLLPVIAKADCMTDEEASDCQVAMKQMLKEPRVPGLEAIDSYRIQTKQAGHPGNIWPLLLSCRAEADDTTGHAGLDRIIHMLSSDEVYNLLDCAWDRYTSFCSAYEDAGKTLEAMSATTCQQIDTLLGGPAVLTALKLGADKTEQLLQEEIEKSRREVGSFKAQLMAHEFALQEKEWQLVDEEKLSDELWELFKSFRKAVGHAQYDKSNPLNRARYQVSKLLPGREISTDLKARYPDMNW